MKDYIEKIAYDVGKMSDKNPEQRRVAIMQEHKQISDSYPLSIKYMCHGLFDIDLFMDMVNTQDAKHLKYEERFVLEGKYLKKLLVKYGESRINALKRANGEVEQCLSEIRHVNRLERNYKRDEINTKKQNTEELRKEFLNVINSLIDGP